MLGSGLSTVKFLALEVPPPGPGFTIERLRICAAVSRASGTATVKCVDVKALGFRILSPSLTVLVETKFEPAIPSETEVLFNGTSDCDRLEMVGAGFSTVNCSTFDWPPPGSPVITSTDSVPL